MDWLMSVLAHLRPTYIPSSTFLPHHVLTPVTIKKLDCHQKSVIIVKMQRGGQQMKTNQSYLYSETRQWGEFHNLVDEVGYKVKRLEIAPGKELSFQRHCHRQEIWTVIEGECIIRQATQNDFNVIPKTCWATFLPKHHSNVVPRGHWHQIYNPYDTTCVILEVQIGDKNEESDIERIPTPKIVPSIFSSSAITEIGVLKHKGIKHG